MGLVLCRIGELPAFAQSDAAAVMPPIRVDAQIEEGGYRMESVTSPKYTGPLVDTPQSITVVP